MSKLTDWLDKLPEWVYILVFMAIVVVISYYFGWETYDY